MRFLLVVGCLFLVGPFLVDKTALAIDAPRPHRAVPEAAQACMIRLTNESKDGIRRLDPGARPRPLWEVFPMGATRLMLDDTSVLHPWEARMLALETEVFPILISSGVVSASLADELRSRGYRRPSQLRAVLQSFWTDFPDDAAQGPFLDSWVERILLRLRVRRGRIDYVYGHGPAPQPEQLHALNVALVDSPHSGFAELQVYLLNVLLSPAPWFVEDVVARVPNLLSFRRLWDWSWGLPYPTLGAVLRERGAGAQGIVGLVTGADRRAQDVLVTRNLPLFTGEQLERLRAGAAVHPATLLRIDERIRELEEASGAKP